MKLTTEVQRAADAERRPVASPIQASGADVEGPRPSGPGRTICEACGQPVGPGICALPGCDRTLDGRRPDARYCSRACNQAARRARKGTRKVHARRRSGQSKIRLASDGARFFVIILKIITLFSPLRIFLPVSAAAFVVGAGYALWTIYWQSHVANSSVLLIMFAVIVFLVGLVSEQISALRFEGRP